MNIKIVSFRLKIIDLCAKFAKIINMGLKIINIRIIKIGHVSKVSGCGI